MLKPLLTIILLPLLLKRAEADGIIRKLEVFSLEKAISYKCESYLSYTPLNSQCSRAAQKVFEILDPVFTKASPHPTCFSKEILKLLSNPKVFDYLKALNSILPSPFEKLDLWEFTLKHAGTKSEALRWLAVLFQDTSQAQNHIVFLKSELLPNALSMASSAELEKSVRFLREFNDELQPQWGLHLKKYLPAEDYLRLYSSVHLYHFYVSGYLSERLLAAHFDPAIAAFISFLFNYNYEVITLFRSPRFLVLEPSSVSDIPTQMEIFMGYWGSRFGVDKELSLDPNWFFEMLKNQPSLLLQHLALL